MSHLRHTVLILVVLTLTQSTLAKVLYVDDDAQGSNNGASWQDAFLCLQNALEVANAGDEIWVAKGVHRPTARIGRPADFTGLVGTFQMTSTLGPASLKAGESATLTIQVEGQSVGLVGHEGDRHMLPHTCLQQRAGAGIVPNTRRGEA